MLNGEQKSPRFCHRCRASLYHREAWMFKETPTHSSCCHLAQRVYCRLTRLCSSLCPRKFLNSALTANKIQLFLIFIYFYLQTSTKGLRLQYFCFYNSGCMKMKFKATGLVIKLLSLPIDALCRSI